jgi:putative transposase
MKKIRLDPEAYRQGDSFSITIATHLRKPLFLRPAASRLAVEVLHEISERLGVAVYAYCLMPNHLHLLAAAPTSDISRFVDRYKQVSSYRLKRLLALEHPVWQTRFYDHGLRREEAIASVAAYIFENPVRAGIVTRAADYAYSGSLAWPDAVSSEAKATDLRDHTTSRPVASASGNSGASQ